MRRSSVLSWSAAVFAVSGVFVSPLLAQPACESAKLLALDGASGDDFGASVAVSGSFAVVGAPEDDDAGSSSGAAYVFSYDGPSWTQQQKLTASDAEGGDDYGFAVAISGDTIVVGSPRDDTIAGSRAGSAYVYTFDGNTWGSEARLFASDAGADDRFGYSVAIDGGTILVGAIQWDGTLSNAGSGYVFVGSGLVWSEQDQLTAGLPSGTNPQMGHSASLDGDVAVLGAWQDAPGGMFSVGAAHVFRRSGIIWSEEQKLTASDAADFRWFGQSVSVSGNVVAVGAYGDRADDLSESGGAYFFIWDGLSWDELNNVNAADPEAGDRFGWSIAVDGDNAIIGTGTSAAKGYLFHRELIDWTQQKTLNSSDPDVSLEYAWSVALAGSTAVIGDRGGASGNGVAFVFDLLGIECVCPWDCGDPPDGEVSVVDFLALLAQWGQVGSSCDVDGGGVGITDFLAMLANWGPCP
jgi:hypothetical protein